LSWRDLWPGAGWGLVDSLGRPKAPVYALRRVLNPTALLATDEGLSGLQLHIVNDRAHVVSGRLEIGVYADDGLRVEYGDDTFEVGPQSAITLSANGLLGGFRDLTWAYRFGPPSYDVVHARLSAAGLGWDREVFYLPLGRGRPRRSDLDLTASVREIGDGEWSMTVTSRLFAQWVVVDVPGFTATDSWFHVAPGTQHELRLLADDPRTAPRGEVRALNSTRPTSLVVKSKS